MAGIQFMRFVAALMVTIYHANIWVNNAFPRSENDPIMLFSMIGAAGVPVFFTISGFVICFNSWSLFQKNAAVIGFLTRRFLRIYPIYWIAMLLYLIGRQWRPDPGALGLDQLLFAALLLPSYAKLVISPAWTLLYEVYFYLLFGLSLWLPRRIALTAISGFFLFCVFTGRALNFPDMNAVLETMTNPVLLEFLAGLLLATIARQQVWAEKIFRRPVIWLLLGGSLVGFAAIPLLRPYHLPAVILLGLPSVMIVWWSVAAEFSQSLPRFMRRVAPLGDSSYSLYLIHQLVMSQLAPLAAWFAAHGFATPLVLLVAYTVAAVITGLGFHYWIENPLLRLLKKKRLPVARTAPMGDPGQP